MKLFGLSFETASLEDTRDRLLTRSRDAPFAYVVTPNADHLDRLARDPALRPVYDAALLRLFDSRCLANMLRLLGREAPTVVTGADLTVALLSCLDGERVAIIGLGETEMAALGRNYPGIDFIHHEPPMGMLCNEKAFAAALRFVRQSGAAFTFFAIGSPAQERLAHAVGSEARGIGLCIGAALTFAAGTRRRAPPWMRRAGLEWSYRLLHEPRRLAGRYLWRGPRIFALLLMQAAGIRTESGQ